MQSEPLVYHALRGARRYLLLGYIIYLACVSVGWFALTSTILHRLGPIDILLVCSIGAIGVSNLIGHVVVVLVLQYSLLGRNYIVEPRKLQFRHSPRIGEDLNE